MQIKKIIKYLHDLKKNNMQKIIILFLLMFVQLSSYSQKISISDENIVSVNKIEFCKIITKGSASDMAYSICNLEGEELIYANQKGSGTEASFILSFTDFEDMALVDASMPIRKMLMKTIVKYDLITNGQLNKNAVNRLCKMKPALRPVQNININIQR